MGHLRTGMRLIRDFLFSRANKEFLLFMFFLIISGGFWLLTTLNESYEQEVTFPVHITNVPKNIMLTSDEIDTIHVTVRDKGTQLLSYLYDENKRHLKVNFRNYDRGNGTGFVPAADLQKLVQQRLSQSAQITVVNGDGLHLYYNTGASKRVPVRWSGHVVPEQMIIDGNFPTVVSPNPENAEAMTLGMKLGTKLNADLVIASDPDADRLAIVCRNAKGEWEIINGNQTCMMFCWYIIANKKKLGQLKGNEFLVKTIVTTEVIRKIAEKNGVDLKDCYTGFKWIANEIREGESANKKYIGGGEESFGFLPFDKVRDKDSPASICLICEIAAWAKDNGKTLYDLLMDIYVEYGFSYEHTINVVRPGKTGADEIKQMMENFRKNPPTDLGGSEISFVRDWSVLEQTNADGSKVKLVQPATSNVLQWFCTDGTKVSVRPSGTEPKIKFYLEIKDPSMKCADCYERCLTAAKAKVEEIKKSLGL